MKMQPIIHPTRQKDFPLWYQQVIKEADLAENATVRGCMIIKPWGYRIWELIQNALDERIKATGHENFYFPLFLPLSLLAKEAKHVEGFAKECAVVTHRRLIANAEKGLVPDGLLDEPLVVRPTSEAMIGEAFSRWIQSYRDLPLLRNQWANVVRWEMRPRLFLRTSEFLWQEGHTAHATKKEALKEANTIVHMYQDFLQDILAIPVIVGEKTESERFPGAEITYTLEAMMQDTKGLQVGTSHFLGQNFAKAFNIQYLSKESKQEYVWTTSWGVTTRLIGGLIMVHSDDNGLVLPPTIAPHQIVIIPMLNKNTNVDAVNAYCKKIQNALKEQTFLGQQLRVYVDSTEKRKKISTWIKKGVPLFLTIGQTECDAQTVSVERRDTQKKTTCTITSFMSSIEQQLSNVQENLFQKAKDFREKNTHFVESDHVFYDAVAQETSGFVCAFWCGDATTENKLKQDFKVTAGCLPGDMQSKRGQCIFTGKADAPLTLFSKSY